MQDMSHLAATNPAAHVRSVAAMSKLARSHDASPLLYGTWGYQVGCPRLEKLGMTAEEMCELMSVGGRRAANAACVPLVDMASIAAQYEKPEDLYAADGIHPSKAGSLLIASISKPVEIALPLDEPHTFFGARGYMRFRDVVKIP